MSGEWGCPGWHKRISGKLFLCICFNRTREVMERSLSVMARQLNRGMVIIILIVSAGFVRVDIASAAIDAEAVRDEILAGVAILGDPGGPGKMVVFGESACSIANYQGQDHRDPMIAAANWGLGRVIALPDHQWLGMDSLGAQADTGRLAIILLMADGNASAAAE